MITGLRIKIPNPQWHNATRGTYGDCAHSIPTAILRRFSQFCARLNVGQPRLRVTKRQSWRQLRFLNFRVLFAFLSISTAWYRAIDVARQSGRDSRSSSRAANVRWQRRTGLSGSFSSLQRGGRERLGLFAAMAAIKGLGRNIPYLRQQAAALLGNTSTSVKAICVVVLFSYCLSFSEEAVRILSVTPGYLLPPVFWFWTAFTFCFLEIHFWEVCVDVVTVGLCGKLIEPLWGAFEMMTFFAIVNFGVAVLSALFYLFLYMCTNNPDLLFNIHIHGLTGYIAGTPLSLLIA